jgi:hypothetical protein
MARRSKHGSRSCLVDSQDRVAIEKTLWLIENTGELSVRTEEPFFKDMFAAYLQLLQEEPGCHDQHAHGCEMWYALYDEGDES